MPSVELSFLVPPHASDEIGRLGPYRVLDILGVGGMGIVFQAEDSRLQRPVALKVMQPDMAKKEVHRVRFLREARAMARVDHPNVVPIYAVDECSGTAYFAMKLLKGATLWDTLNSRGGRLPLDEVLRIGREVAGALGAAHAQGLIHRDVKPTNIWIEERTQNTLLIDFGLARIVSADDLRVTNLGGVLGTVAFMSPEQANGEEVDHRSDLYSLGCVLYLASTGALPLPGKVATDEKGAAGRLGPEPPHVLDPALPRRFSDIVMRLLSKDRQGRPSDCTALIEQLKAATVADPAPEVAPVQLDAAVKAEPVQFDTGARMNPAQPSRRKWLIVWLVGLIVGAAVVAGIVWRSPGHP
jgi:serine/threonine protein kinase